MQYFNQYIIIFHDSQPFEQTKFNQIIYQVVHNVCDIIEDIKE